VYELGGKLLHTLAEARLPRGDETIKAIGWFLVCIGESMDLGSYSKAKHLRVQIKAGQNVEAASLPVSFCLKGIEIMDWSTGMLLQEKKQ
jgi:hypothetical protein